MRKNNRRLPPRRMEALAHVSSWLAVVLTAVMVWKGPIAEPNPVALEIMGHVGFVGFALLTPVLISLLYRLLHRYGDHHFYFALPAGLLAADALGNVAVVASTGLPETVPVMEIGALVAPVGALALVCYVRVERLLLVISRLSQRRDKDPVRRLVTVALSILLITAIFGPFVAYDGSIVQNAQAASGTVIDDFEDGSFDWSISSGSFSTTPSPVASGDYAAVNDKSGSDAQTSFTSISPNNVSMYYHGQGSVDDRLIWRSDSASQTDGWVINCGIGRSGSTIECYDGGGWVSSGVTLPSDEYVHLQFENIDFGNDTFEIEAYDMSGNLIDSSGTMDFDSASSDLDGIEWWSNTGGTAMDNFRYNSEPEFTSTVSGQAKNQNGQPASNATIRLTTVNTSAIDSSDPIQEGKDRITNASDITPSTWDKSLDLRSNKFATDSRYVAVTQKSLHDRPFFLDSGDVSDPQLQVPADEELVLTVWDGSASPSLFDDEYESQLPGKPVDDGTVVIEKISATGEVVERQTNSTDETVSGGFLDPSEMSYATVSGLNPGYYRISSESSDVSYVIQVGSPTEVFDSSLEDVNSTLTDRSAWTRDQIENGPMAMQTVTTNSTGHFSASVPANAEVVGVQGIKASSLDVPEENLTVADIRANSSQLDGSIYMPSRVYKVEPPASDVTVRMYEAKYPQFGNLSEYQGQLKDLLDRLRNGSFSDLPPAFQEGLNSISDQRLEETNIKLDRLSRENDRLRERFNQEANERDVNVSVDIEDANRTQLTNRMAAMQEALNSLESTVDTELVDEGSGGGETTISRTWEIGDSRTDVDPDATAVRIDYSNGTTAYLNASESGYVTVDNRAFRSDTVSVNQYPLGDASAAEVSVIAATSEGIGKASDSATNPSLSGDVPQLRAVDASTLVPETGEHVSLTVRPQEETGFKSVTGATVYGPDGTAVNSSLSADTLEFTPTQTGAHRVQLTFNNLNGDQFTEVVRLEAVENGQDRPASVRAVSGPTGTYALVGGPLQSGEIDVQDGGATLDVTAVATDANETAEVHVYTEGMSLAPDHTTTVNVVEGDDEKRIDRNARIVMHAPALPEDAYVYRVEDGDKEPLPEGKSATGILRSGDENATIQTYTDTNGEVGIRTIASPTTLQKVDWFIQTRLPDISMPGMAFAPVRPFAAPGGA